MEQSSWLLWYDHRHTGGMDASKRMEAFIQKVSKVFEYQIKGYTNLIRENQNLNQIILPKKRNF